MVMQNVRRLKVDNFRSHMSTELDFSDRNTILVTGNNGSGKTSLLEAIHLCLRGKSFKTTKSELLLRRNSPHCRAEITLGDTSRVFYYDASLKQKTFV
jgi:recombinational DNA repair ATPase RecF